MVAEALDRMGIWHPNPRATLYFWCLLPEAWGRDDIKFAGELLETEGFVVGPGSAYGPHGKGFFRLSLTTPEDDIRKGLARLEAFLKRKPT
jgi:LL-diaminopimelate aminotransferase